MRYWILAALMLLLWGAPARAQLYSYQTTSVTSSTVPVNIMPLQQRSTYACTTLSSASGPVDVWGYTTSATPAAKATNYTVINAGTVIGDAIPTGSSNSAVNQAQAAVLDSGSSAVTVFCWWR